MSSNVPKQKSKTFASSEIEEANIKTKVNLISRVLLIFLKGLIITRGSQVQFNCMQTRGRCLTPVKGAKKSGVLTLQIVR